MTTWALQKRLHQSWCCVWCWLGWPKEPCIRWGPDPHVRGNFEGEVGPAHWHSHCISAAPCWVASSFSTAGHVRASPGLVQCGCCLWRTRWWCTLPSHPCAAAVWPYVRLLQWPPHHHHNPFMALFPGPPGWAGARRELLDFMMQGEINRGRHTDHPAGCHPAGCHSIQTNQCPPPPSPHIFYGPVALPAAQTTVSKHWRQVAHSE